MERKIRIIDKRIKEKYLMDDGYLNGYARLCGWKGSIVYMSLCRHASRDQYCFPSVKLMAEEHNVSRDTVMDGLKALEAWNIIYIHKERRKDGTWLNNAYTLLDKSVWKEKPQVANSYMDSHVANSVSPSRSQQHIQVANIDSKDTHREGNTSKETHTATPSVAGEIVQVIDAFKDVNPSYKKWFNHKTERGAAERLIETHGLELVLQVIAILPKTNNMQYVPTITTPSQLEDKWAALQAALIKKKQGQITNARPVFL